MHTDTGGLFAGWNLFNISPWCSSIERYGAAAILLHGLLSAGSANVRQACLDDRFASRPAVGAQIRARTALWSSVASLAGPIVGAELSRWSRNGALWAAASGSLMQLPFSLFAMETLPPQDRTQKFKLRSSNPVQNVMILWQNGPGLRGLAVTNFLYHLSNGVERTKGDYVMGSMDWTPQDLSYFGSFQGLLGVFSQSTVVVRFFATIWLGWILSSWLLFLCYSDVRHIAVISSYAVETGCNRGVSAITPHLDGGCVWFMETVPYSLCYNDDAVDVRSCVPTGTPDNHNQAGHLSDHCRPGRAERCLGWHASCCRCCLPLALVT
eukprot:SAG31_NODE_1583_length_7828_cov_1.884332_7_plen_324_part_00